MRLARREVRWLTLALAIIVATTGIFLLLRPAQAAPAALSGPTTAAVDSPAGAVEPTLGLTLTLGAGLYPWECATESNLVVVPGTTVYFCYVATNSGTGTFVYHEIEDSVDGPLPGFFADLAPGSSLDSRSYVGPLSQVVTTDTTRSGTWTAMDQLERNASATVSTTVRIGTPAITVDKFVSASPICSAETDLLTLAGEDVYYCVQITNTGDFTFTEHTIRDALLGIDVTLPYTLAPGASVTLSNAELAPLGPVAVTGDVTNTVVVTSVLVYAPVALPTGAGQELPLLPEVEATGSATATVRIGTAAIEVTKLVAASDTCAGSTELQLPADKSVYYCVVITNTGDFTFTQHQISDPLLGINATLDLQLAPGATATVSNDQVAALGPVVLTGPITNTVMVTSTNVPQQSPEIAGALLPGVAVSASSTSSAVVVDDVPTADLPWLEPVDVSTRIFLPLLTQ